MNRPVVVLALVLAIGCGNVAAMDASFPPLPAAGWTIPLERPIATSHAFVRATLKNEDRESSVGLLIDSGASHSTLHDWIFQALAIEPEPIRNLVAIDAAGRRRPWLGAVVPLVDLGPVTTSETPFASATMSVLGVSFLGEHPWTIDFDRGLLVVGEPRWEGEDVVTVPLGGIEPNEIEVSIDGEDVPMTFDTGATISSIDADVAIELGLERRRLRTPRRTQTMSGHMAVREVFVARELRVGPLVFSDVELIPTRHGERAGLFAPTPAQGLLGMDLLGRYLLRVDLGEEVQLRPRRPLLETVGERVSRWGMPAECDGAPGCVRTTLEVGEHGATIVLDAIAAFTDPVRFLFHCVDRDGRPHGSMPAIELAVVELPRGETRIEIRHDASDPYVRVFARHAERQCGSIALLDIDRATGLGSSEQGYGIVLLQNVR